MEKGRYSSKTLTNQQSLSVLIGPPLFQDKIHGPAIIEQLDTTTPVYPGDIAKVSADGHLISILSKGGKKMDNDKNELDPISLEIISNGLRSITDECFVALTRSSYSTNIKERKRPFHSDRR